MITLFDFKGLRDCQFSIRQVVTNRAMQSVVGFDDMKYAVIRDMSEQLAGEIMKNQRFFSFKPCEVLREPIGLEFSADVIVLTSEELSKVVQEAYVKGMNSGR